MVVMLIGGVCSCLCMDGDCWLSFADYVRVTRRGLEGFITYFDADDLAVHALNRTDLADVTAAG